VKGITGTNDDKMTYIDKEQELFVKMKMLFDEFMKNEIEEMEIQAIEDLVYIAEFLNFLLKIKHEFIQWLNKILFYLNLSVVKYINVRIIIMFYKYCKLLFQIKLKAKNLLYFKL
jgi:hypothetical protein